MPSASNVSDPSKDAPTSFFLKEVELPELLSALGRGPIYATVPDGGSRPRFERIDPAGFSKISLRSQPAVDPAKSFLFPPKERVARYPDPDPKGPPEAGSFGCPPPEAGEATPDDSPQVLLGIRACDLISLEILDRIFLEGDFVDPFYAGRRNRTFLMSCDCVAPAATCFCEMVGGKPHAERSYDLNLTPLEGGYLVDIGSTAGKEAVLDSIRLFREATGGEIAEREKVRASSLRKLEEQNAPFRSARPIDQALEDPGASDRWLPLAAACVECGGCSYVCPTCHCFMLYDQVARAKLGLNERIKAWDSCLFGSFARMAGAGSMKITPRPELTSRFENRIRHKYQWFKQTYGCLGCVGCGRCSEACLGGLDIRRVMGEIGGPPQ